MEIIRHGKPPKEFRKIFKCRVCGCIFKASPEEYQLIFVRNQYLFRADCPECGAVCKKDAEE